MSYEQALRDYDLMLMNPPVIDAPDEPCDGCGREIGNDFAVKVRLMGQLAGMTGLMCDECAVQVERCSDCQCIRCECES